MFRGDLRTAALAAALLAAPGQAAADTETDARLDEVERKVEVLTDEVEKSLIERVVPDVLESRYGMGPAASKVYHIERGLSLGGYGEARYRNFVTENKTDELDFLRLVLYAGYKFTDKVLFNSEIEFEHAGTSGGGSASVEFATLDFLLCDGLNVRAGLVLVPMGFINEMHEPVTFYGASRPEVERQIMPSTWREGGAGLFGSLGGRVDYKLYAVNGFKASGFDGSGLRGGRQKGSQALADDWAMVARVDAYPLGGWQLGGSVYHGYSGQELAFDVSTTVWELHTQFEKAGARARGLFSMAHIGDTDRLLVAGKSVSSEMLGGYAELAYDVVQHVFPASEQTLEPFYRYEYLDTQRDLPAGATPLATSAEQQIHTVGVSYQPIPQVVLKVDYRNRDALAAIADEVHLGIGFVF